MIFLLFIIIGIIRFSIISKGFLAFPDETRYLYSVFAVRNLFQAQYSKFWLDIYSTFGRPFDVIIRLIPAYIQVLIELRWGIPADNQTSLIIPAICNVLVSLILLFVFYKITLYLIKDKTLSLFALIFYAFVVNSNIYLRHLLPYDTALLFNLISLYITLKNSPKISYILLNGLLAGISFGIYPGYFFFNLIILIIIASKINNIRRFLLLLIPYGAILFSVLFIYQYFSMFSTINYANVLRIVSENITQGSFDESLIYGFKYLTSVESVSGIGFLILLCGLLINSIFDIFRKRTGFFKIKNITVFAGLIAYLAYAFMGFTMHKFVFYGRILHALYPFLIWSAIIYIQSINNFKIRSLIIYCQLSAILLVFVFFYINYLHLGYPRDVLYQYGIQTTAVPFDQHQYEGKPLWSIPSPAAFNEQTGYPYVSRQKIILVNFCYFYPVDDVYNPFRVSQGYKQMLSIKHFQSFLPYWFEGFGPKERNILKDRQYKLMVFEPI